MKASIESTEQMIRINGIAARVWKGTTERGVPIQLAVTRIAVNEEADQTQFQEELQAQHAPTVAQPAFPLSMIL